MIGNAASQQKSPATVATTTAGLLLTVTVLDVTESSDYETVAGQCGAGFVAEHVPVKHFLIDGSMWLPA